MKEKVQCPVCLGKGTIMRERRGIVLTKNQEKELFALYAQGKTLRAIASHFGFKNPQSVQHIINKAKNGIY